MGDAPTPVGPNDWVAERLAEIDRMADTTEKVEVLLAFESELLPSSSKVFHQALTAAATLQDDSAKAYALGAIAPHLPESDPALLERALSAADTIQNEIDKVRALIAIAPRLPESRTVLLEHVLTATDNMGRDDSKAMILRVHPSLASPVVRHPSRPLILVDLTTTHLYLLQKWDAPDLNCDRAPLA